MMSTLLYLLQVSVCLTVCYGLYIIFFRHATFFMLNRVYLVATLILAFIIPATELSFTPPDRHVWTHDIVTFVTTTVSPENPGEASVGIPKSTDHTMLLTIIYWCGVVLMTFRLLYAIIRILKIKNRSTILRKDQVKIVQTNLSHPFCFFNLIFLPAYEVNPLILEHEKVHIRQLHWIDLFVMEIAAVLLWFNPIMIFYKRALKTQHEYLADAGALGCGVPLEHYLKCMLHQIELENSVGPISQFYSRTIKNRILMMTKNKTPRTFPALYLLTIPVVSMLLFAFSDQPTLTRSSGNHPGSFEDSHTVIIVDAGHGGHDRGAHGNAAISEKEIVLSMAKSIKQAGEAKGIRVILTRTSDEALTLAERTALAKGSAADLFISLHAGYDAQNNTTSGIACIVSQSNSRFNESQRFAAQLVKEFEALGGVTVNGILTSDPYVLKNNDLPAVILELGYLSNPTDLAFIHNTKNQEQVADRIIASVIQYSK